MKRTGMYLRPDISVEYHTRNIRHRFFRRFDVYAGLKNITEMLGPRFSNQGEVYWITWEYPAGNYYRLEQRMHLMPFTMVLGGRFVLGL